jgi:hypothetical protein
MMQILLVAPALLTVAYGQGVIVSAQGASGSPASLAMQVKLSDTSDANIIRQSEVAGNIVNECGRTLLAGNSTYSLTSQHILWESSSQVIECY